MATWQTHRARIARMSQDLPPDDPRIVDEKRALREIRLAEYITRTVDAAPPLTDEQRDRLAALLRPVPAGCDAA